MREKIFSEEDIRLIKYHYPRTGIEELTVLLPNFTKLQIRNKAQRLKLEVIGYIKRPKTLSPVLSLDGTISVSADRIRDIKQVKDNFIVSLKSNINTVKIDYPNYRRLKKEIEQWKLQQSQS